MGYYSNVRAITTKKGYERFLELIYDDDRWFIDNYPGFSRTEYDDTVLFGWNDVKWYEEYSEVDAVMGALEIIASDGHPFEYLRIGEELDDIEVREHDPDKLNRHIAIARTIYSY